MSRKSTAQHNYQTKSGIVTVTTEYDEICDHCGQVIHQQKARVTLSADNSWFTPELADDLMHWWEGGFRPSDRPDWI